MNTRRLFQSRVSGQSIVEFALVVTVFFILVMAIIDLGRGVFTHNMLSNAAREGARVGIISGNSAVAMCNQVVADAVVPEAASVTCGTTVDTSGKWTCPDASHNPYLSQSTGGVLQVWVCRGTAGDTTKVDRVIVQYRFNLVSPVLLGLANPLTLTASSSMYVEP